MSSDSKSGVRADALRWVADRAGAYVAARSFSFFGDRPATRARWANEVTMSLYQSVGTAVGTREALDLARRLAVWHDAMVRHRRLTGDAIDSCEMDCPHEQAAALWLEAVDVYGERALGLEFLRSVGRAAGQHDHASVDGLSL